MNPLERAKVSPQKKPKRKITKTKPKGKKKVKQTNLN